MIHVFVPSARRPRRRGGKSRAKPLALASAAVLAAAGLAVVPPPTASKAMTIFAVSGVVFYDKNTNGVRDSGEWGIPGLQLALYSDFDKDGVWQLESDPGTHPTGSSGAYTFLMSGYGTYQVRVATLDFNPKANPDAANFESAVHQNTLPTFQTAASAGSASLPRTSSRPSTAPNSVVAHCYDAATRSATAVKGVSVQNAYGATVPTLSCFGAQAWPYNNPAMPALAANMKSPSYTLDNRSGTAVPVYSTVIVASDLSPIPNADFGLATTADEDAMNAAIQQQINSLIALISDLFKTIFANLGGLFGNLAPLR